MKKAFKILLPIVIILIIATAGLYLFIFLGGVDMTTEKLVASAETALAAEKYEKAVSRYETAANLSNGDPEILIALADAYADAGNYTKAEYTLTHAITDNPSEADFYVALSRIFVTQDKLLDAVELLNSITDTTVLTEINALRPEAPSFSPGSGEYNEFIDVSLSFPSGCTAYCSGNGDYPSTVSDTYQDAKTLDVGETKLLALSVSADGLVSSLAEEDYIVGNVVQEISFTDREMERITRDILQLDEIEPIMSDDVWEIKSLTVTADVQVLDDLKWFTGLQSIYFEDMENIDLQQLLQLTDLQILYMKNCGIDSTGLQAIGQITSLSELYLSGNTLVSLGGISTLTDLTVLDVSDNSVRDLSPIAGFTKLTELNISENPIDALTSLATDTGMRILNASNTGVSNLKGVDDMMGLESIDITGCQVKTLAPLEGIKTLKTVLCGSNQLSDINALVYATELDTLDLQSNKLTDISSVSGMSKLKTLNVSSNLLTTLPDLSALTILTNLDASKNTITDITALSALTSLNYLNLDYNQVTDLSPLYTIQTLVQVDVFGNLVEDADTLIDMGIVVNK